jgi:hypothetical protein
MARPALHLKTRNVPNCQIKLQELGPYFSCVVSGCKRRQMKRRLSTKSNKKGNPCFLPPSFHLSPFPNPSPPFPSSRLKCSLLVFCLAAPDRPSLRELPVWLADLPKQRIKSVANRSKSARAASKQWLSRSPPLVLDANDRNYTAWVLLGQLKRFVAYAVFPCGRASRCALRWLTA